MNHDFLWFINAKGGKNKLTSLRDYAASRHITYEAVRQSVKRYADELQGHITTNNRTQYLDDAAVALLDDHRQGNPVVVINQDRIEEIERLQRDNVALLQRVTALQDALIRAQGRIIDTANQQARLAAAEHDRDELQRAVDAAHAREVATAAETARTVAEWRDRALTAEAAHTVADAKCRELQQELAAAQQSIFYRLKNAIKRKK